MTKPQFSIARLMAAIAVIAMTLFALRSCRVPPVAIAILLPVIASPLVMSTLFMPWLHVFRVHLVIWAGGIVGWYTTSLRLPLANVFLAVPAGIAALGVFDLGCYVLLGKSNNAPDPPPG